LSPNPVPWNQVEGVYAAGDVQDHEFRQVLPQVPAVWRRCWQNGGFHPMVVNSEFHQAPETPDNGISISQPRKKTEARLRRSLM